MKERGKGNSRMYIKFLLVLFICIITIAALIMLSVGQQDLPSVFPTFDGLKFVWIILDKYAGESKMHSHIPAAYLQPNPDFPDAPSPDIVAAAHIAGQFNIREIQLTLVPRDWQWEMSVATNWNGFGNTTPGGAFLRPENSNVWMVYFDLATQKLYLIKDFNNRIIYSEDLSGHLQYYRKEVPVQIDNVNGIPVIGNGSWRHDPGYFLINFNYINLHLGDTIVIHWTMSCGNDIVMGIFNQLPAMNATPTPTTTPTPTKAGTPVPTKTPPPIPFPTETPRLNPIPEPSTVIMLAIGLLILMLFASRKRSK